MNFYYSKRTLSFLMTSRFSTTTSSNSSNLNSTPNNQSSPRTATTTTTTASSSSFTPQNISPSGNTSIDQKRSPTAYPQDWSEPPVTSEEARLRVLRKLRKPISTTQKWALFLTGRENKTKSPKQPMNRTISGLFIIIMGNVSLAWYLLHVWGLNHEENRLQSLLIERDDLKQKYKILISQIEQ